MRSEDFDQFSALLDDVSDLRQLPYLKASAKALFFKAVARYPLELIQKAIEAHLIDPEAGKFKTQIQPAHIVAQIENAASNDGRPEADEAWAIALQAQDENRTVVWNEDIATAAGIARPILDAGDEVGGRMAFKAAYIRIVKEARAALRPARWMPSLGLDPTQREDALQRAVTAGLLPAPHVAGLLPPPTTENAAADDAVTETSLARIRALLARAVHRPSAAEKASQSERERLERLKAHSQALAGGEPADSLWPVADLANTSSEARP